MFILCLAFVVVGLLVHAAHLVQVVVACAF
jgi:hypothetical protein